MKRFFIKNVYAYLFIMQKKNQQQQNQWQAVSAEKLEDDETACFEQLFMAQLIAFIKCFIKLPECTMKSYISAGL